MRKTYYYCHEMPEKKDWLRESMGELSKYIAMPPAEIEYELKELPEEYEKDILDIFKKHPKSIHDWEIEIVEYFAGKEGQAGSFLVICPEGSHLEKVAKKAKPNAIWGIATYSLSIVYRKYDPYIIWHEMLHLLGADDCYDLAKGDRGPNCGLPNCIMQFEPLKRNVGAWPFLCAKNIHLINQRLDTWK